MLIFRFGEKIEEPCTLVLGGFDGLHCGHRALLTAAKETGFPVAVTCVTGGKGKCLFTLPERAYLLERAGAKYLLDLPFTEELKSLSPEEFLKKLFLCVYPKTIFCGEDFRFGKDAAGTPELLKEFAPCPVRVLPLVKEKTEDGRLRKISTSSCKNFLKAGDLARLNTCLAPCGVSFIEGAYFIEGAVEHGKQIGRTYGFPTLNLTPLPEKLLPPDGVYRGICTTPKGDFPTIINIGARPTFGSSKRILEAYLDGFSGDLYGATVRVFPMDYLRGIRKFSSVEELKNQLCRDKETLKEIQ